MMPLGANSRMNASDTSFGWNSQYTCDSRTRRAMSCVTWEPKSRIRILSCDMDGGSCRLCAQHLVVVEEAPGGHRGGELQRRAREKRQPDQPIARRPLRHPAQQL